MLLNVTTCPWHGAPIVSACTLTQCDLFIPGHESHCGLVAYQQVLTDLQPNEEIGWDKLAQWLELPEETVSQLAQQAYGILRQERAAVEPVLPELTRVPNSRRCVVCNRKALLFEGPWGWCSKGCKDWLPKEAVDAEQRWGQQWRKLLAQWGGRRPHVISQLTGLPLPTVRWLQWQHTGRCSVNHPRRWLKCEESLVPNPKVPTAQQLHRRLQLSKRWRETT